MSSFKERIFVFPGDGKSNKSISEYSTMVQDEPYLSAECYFGKNKINLPLYEIEKVFLNFLKKTESIAFYAFEQKTKDGRKQFFYSQNINKKSKDETIKKILELIKKIEEEKVVA